MVTLLCTVRDCRTPLTRDERRYVCERNHAFDIARSGYVNLLQPQDKRSKNPGDTNEAVAARRRFLEAGYAEPLVRDIVEFLPVEGAMLDAGCGEGHHLAAFRRAYGLDAYGTDISVPAIELAAKRHRDCHWSVANADRLLPYGDMSFNAVTSITARLSVDEYHRVLKPDGELLIVIPGADDLIELREAILGDRVERDRVERTVSLFAPRFTLARHRQSRHVTTLPRQAMLDVMSSSYRGLRSKEREKLERLDPMEVTLSRDLLVFQWNSST